MNLEYIGIGIAILALGIALMVGVPPPWWPKMPPILIHLVVLSGLAIALFGLGVIVYGFSPFTVSPRTGPLTLSVVGVVLLIAGVAWYLFSNDAPQTFPEKIDPPKATIQADWLHPKDAFTRLSERLAVEEYQKKVMAKIEADNNYQTAKKEAEELKVQRKRRAFSASTEPPIEGWEDAVKKTAAMLEIRDTCVKAEQFWKKYIIDELCKNLEQGVLIATGIPPGTMGLSRPINKKRWAGLTLDIESAEATSSDISYRGLGLASPNSSAKYIGVQPIVIAELEFIDVQRKVFTGNFMKRADDAALNQGPEAFDGIGVNRAVDIFACAMVDHAMREAVVQVLIAPVVIGGDQADFIGHSFVDEGVKRIGVNSVNDTRDHVALALHCADNDCLPMPASPAEVTASAFAPVFVFGFAADIRFVYFNVANKLLKFDIAKCYADFVAHVQRGFIRAKTHVALHLQRAYAFLAGEHQMHNAKPLAEVFVRVLKNGPDHDREPIALRRALFALPMEGAGFKAPNLVIAAARAAHNTIRPAIVHKVLFARAFIREQVLKLHYAHLVNLHRVFGGGHSYLLTMEKLWA